MINIQIILLVYALILSTFLTELYMVHISTYQNDWYMSLL